VTAGCEQQPSIFDYADRHSHDLASTHQAPGETAMSATDQLLRNNERYAQGFDKGTTPLPPARGVAVVACMDARLDVHGILGLEVGDAHVIRNAGGVVSEDAIRSLVISQRLLGTREIILIHHTDCGMLTFHDDEVKAAIESEVGIRPWFALEAFPDLARDVRQSIARIVASPFIPHRDRVRGFIYHVESGRLEEVPAEVGALAS
jgi:carbonic anhydrase